jgi:nucleoid DNA-binding protein
MRISYPKYTQQQEEKRMNNTVNKKAIVNKIAEKTGLYKKDIREMLFAFQEVIQETMQEGDRILLHGFLTIKPVLIREKQYYDLQEQGLKTKPAHTIIKCYPGSELRAMEEWLNEENIEEESIQEEEKYNDD